MGNSILDIQAIYLARKSLPVLHDVSFSVMRNEVLVIIGASGSGKSSLLRCLNRLDDIKSGQILFDGVDIQNIPILSLRRQIGMVFQKSVAFAGTVAANINYAPQLRGEPLYEETILQLMQQAALEPDLLKRDATTLSGGQEQRLSIARALANQPTVLLLDEPTSALDPVATHKIEEILLKLRDETGLSLIWVSHSIEQARRVADRVLYLEAGRVIRWDTASALLDEDSGDERVLDFAHGIDQEDH